MIGKLKLIGIFLISLFIIDSSIKAEEQQKIEYGLKAGINLSTLNGKNSALNYNSTSLIESSSKLGILGGGFLKFYFSDKFVVQPELYYTNKGVNFDAEDYIQTWSLDYIEMPLLFQSIFKMSNKYPASVYAGPVVSYLLSATWNDQILEVYQNEDEELKGLNSLDFSAAIGGSLEFEAFGGYVGLDLRYTYGMITLKDGINTTNGTISVSLFYVFKESKDSYY